jgi:hypothetical protein
MKFGFHQSVLAACVLLMTFAPAFPNLIQAPPTSSDGTISQAPYGGALVTQFGTYNWAGVFTSGPPTYYLLLNGTQVDAGDELEIANGGNVYLLYGPDWYGPWDPVNHFGTSANPAIHLPTIKFDPVIASGLSDGTAAGTAITMIVGKNADGSSYGGNYSMSAAVDGAVLAGNRIVVGPSGLTAGTATYVHGIQMLAPGTASPSSTAPSGPNISNSDGTWSWGAATAGRPGDYDILLNGVQTGSGNLIQLFSGLLYANTVVAGWYIYNSAAGHFDSSTNPNGS